VAMFARRRPLLRAAVVGGGAYMAGKSTARRQAERAQMEDEQDARVSGQQQQASYQQQQPQPAQQVPSQRAPDQAASSPMIDQLNQLADLHQQGVLSDEEFAAAKAKLFGS
jgi:Short C-terminal domain